MRWAFTVLAVVALALAAGTYRRHRQDAAA
jgi:hypothetical protein